MHIVKIDTGQNHMLKNTNDYFDAYYQLSEC